MPRPVVLLLVVLLTGCGAATPPGADAPAGRPATTAGAWERLPDPPLSIRWGPVVAWVGGRLVVVGGDTGEPCPPNADCVMGPLRAADGAAYDPRTGRWAPIADAPSPVADLAPHAVVGDRLYVETAAGLLSYSAGADSWSRLEVPSGHPEWLTPVAAGDRLALVSSSDEQVDQPDLVLDTASGRWSRLPNDPLGRSFDRTLAWTPEGLVVTGKEILKNDQPADPALVRAALLPPGSDSWRRLPDSDQLGGAGWSWTGRRLVDATPGGADGGEINGYGHTIPYGGRLDPSSGRWTRLPDAPAEFTGGWPVDAPQGALVATAGWLYDDTAGTWTRLAAPADAPAQPGPAAWGQGRLYVVGGLDEQAHPYTKEHVYSTHAWVLDLA